MEFAEQLFTMLDDDTKENLSYKPPKGLKARLINKLVLTGNNDGKDYAQKSDIEFIVGPEKQSFYGRRFIFGLVSPWFRERLYGPEKPAKLEIPDITPAVFRCIFNVAYGLPPELNVGNVFEVLEGANRLNVSVLLGECLGMLAKNLNAQNVLSVFQTALEQDLLTVQFERACCSVILQNPKEVMESDGFLSISPILMQKMVECDFLAVDEVDLWQRLILWAKCQRARAKSACEEKDEANEEYQVGQEVILATGKIGTIKFKGDVQFGPGLFYGIDLKDGKGDTSGTVDGQQYFEASSDVGGVFVKGPWIVKRFEVINLEDWGPTCKCGAIMKKMTVREAYESGSCNCDGCKETIEGEVFHCPQKGAPEHPSGYDLCENCANKEKAELETRLQFFTLTAADAEYIKEILPYVRFPRMPTKYFVKEVAPLLPLPLVQSVLISKIDKNRVCVFPSHERQSWDSVDSGDGDAGNDFPYEVIKANAEFEKAKNIPNPNVQAEWSRESMDSHEGRQWFICDFKEPVKINKVDMKNYYGDGDTVKVIEVHALDPTQEYNEDEPNSDAWLRQCEFNSEKTNSWQKDIAIETQVMTQYWKFTVTEVWGGSGNYCCLDHLKCYGDKADDTEAGDLKPRESESRYSVIYASKNLDKAQQLPNRGADAEWSRVKMEDSGGPQYFIADFGNNVRPTKLEMKHRYSDNDTIKDLELWYLPPAFDMNDSQNVDEGGNWVKAGQVVSAQSTEVQVLPVNINKDIAARFWKFRVVSLYGGGPTCGNYPCMNYMVVKCLLPVWTTGLCEVLENIELEAPSVEE